MAKKNSRWLALGLAGILTVSSSIPTLAEEENQTEEPAEITVEVSEEEMPEAEISEEEITSEDIIPEAEPTETENQEISEEEFWEVPQKEQEESLELEEPIQYEEDMFFAFAEESNKENDTVGVADGTYTADDFAFSYTGGTGKAKLSCESVVVSEGAAKAVIRISSKSYTHFYLGRTGGSEEDTRLYDPDTGETDANVYELMHDGNGSYVELPMMLDQDVELAGRTTAMSEPHWVNYTIHISFNAGEEPTPTDEPTPTEPVQPTPTEPEKPTPGQDEKPEKPPVKPTPEKKTIKVADTGTYDVSDKIVYTGTMFRIVACKLTSKGDKMTATVTLSGEGYDMLCVGDKDYKYHGTGPGGGYQFRIPISALDTKITILARGKKSGKWFEKSITVPSKGLKWHKVKVDKKDDKKPGRKPSADVTPSPSSGDSGKNGGGNNSGGNNGGGNSNNRGSNGGNSSGTYQANTNGTTASVQGSTRLADGTYKPDSFSWSGGTGKVNITCDEIIIRDGKSYARIVYSSSHYQYVKAGGQKIDCSHEGGTSSAVIPIELNANNEIIGMTTAMSVPHEIKYQLYFGLSAAGSSSAGGGSASASSASPQEDKTNGGSGEQIDSASKTLDEKAPSIPGLSFKSETEITYSKLIKIYNYSDDYKLIEINVGEGTEVGEDTLNSDMKKKTQKSAAEGEADSGTEMTIADQKAAVYQAKIIRYLVVPKGKNAPAGLDKKVAIIKQPTDQSYVASEEVLKMLDEMKLIKNVRSVGVAAKDMKIKSIAAAMEKDETEKDAILYGGSFDKIDYKQIIKEKINLMIQSPEILPKKKKGKSDKDNKSDEILKKQHKLYDKTAKHAIQAEMAMLVDRSGDEKNKLAKAEWYKVYGAVFGDEKKAQEQYKAVVDQASKKEKDEALKELKKTNGQ